MRFGMAICLAAGVAAGCAAKPEGAPVADALQGTWQLSTGEAEGKKLSEEQLKGGTLDIDGDKYTVQLPDVGTITGTQKLDPTQAVKTIDITDASGPNEGKTCLGIYEVKGDEFHVVFAAPGASRPTKFETQPDSGEWMHVWTRVPKQSAAPAPATR